MPTIVNPFAGWPISWTWADHIRNGYEGGTDYAVPPGHPVTAAMDGTAVAVADGLNSVSITAPDGTAVTVRELATRTGTFPRTVKQGQQIGTTGRLGTKYPHIDATLHGQRTPFEPLITPTTSTSSTGKTPLTKPKRAKDMETLNITFKAGEIPGMPAAAHRYLVAPRFLSNPPTADYANAASALTGDGDNTHAIDGPVGFLHQVLTDLGIPWNVIVPGTPDYVAPSHVWFNGVVY